MIDWMQFAKMNNLSPAQFEKEILTVAAVIGAMKIDQNEGDEDSLKFTCSDSVGEIVIYIRRLNE
ncbi:hypothetical protein UFOVP581_48 [uncultured Caudovirales phage]|uniref:Uncharacterized protein n=1 Tax=uncultured Caudovirales phage TaxID=2100421 RepID=A0A6J5PHY9_9CAUD|nr:hypothetical protein UFOVP581_48 [uncultured Caudovirales phage]